MPGLEFGGVAGLLLLVLPGLAALWVLLTAPVARAIGRRQHEEEQVARAPLLVAGIAALIEAGLALVVLRKAGAAEIPLPVGSLYFELSPYGLSSVFTLTAVLLVLLAATELSQARPGVLAADQLAGVLFAWGAHCFLALSGSLPTALTGVWLVSTSVSVLLLLEAFRHARWGKLWLLAWTVLVPVGALILLLPFRGIDLGADLIDARVLLRTGGLRAAEGLLLRLWLAGGLAAITGLIAFAGTPRVPVSFSPGPIAFTAGALAGVLPALFRVTLSVLPASSLADGRLGPHLRTVWVVPAVVALLLALWVPGPFRRLCLLCTGAVCGMGWLGASLDATHSAQAIVGPLGAALALPLCFAAVHALETAGVLPSAAPRWLPWSAVVLFPAMAALWGLLGGFSDPRAREPAIMLGNVLFVALLVASGVALGLPLAKARQEAVRHGQFPRSTSSLPVQQLSELVVVVPWIVLIATAVACWSVGLRELPRLLS